MVHTMFLSTTTKMQNVANPATEMAYIKQAVELPNLKLNKVEGETVMTDKEYAFQQVPAILKPSCSRIEKA